MIHCVMIYNTFEYIIDLHNNKQYTTLKVCSNCYQLIDPFLAHEPHTKHHRLRLEEIILLSFSVPFNYSRNSAPSLLCSKPRVYHSR